MSILSEAFVQLNKLNEKPNYTFNKKTIHGTRKSITESIDFELEVKEGAKEIVDEVISDLNNLYFNNKITGELEKEIRDEAEDPSYRILRSYCADSGEVDSNKNWVFVLVASEVEKIIARKFKDKLKPFANKRAIDKFYNLSDYEDERDKFAKEENPSDEDYVKDYIDWYKGEYVENKAKEYLYDNIDIYWDDDSPVRRFTPELKKELYDELVRRFKDDVEHFFQWDYDPENDLPIEDLEMDIHFGDIAGEAADYICKKHGIK